MGRRAGIVPGGIANLAVATRRLGLRTSLAAAFSDDDYGDFCWRTLEEQEHIDLARSRRFAELAQPGDRVDVGRPRPQHGLARSPGARVGERAHRQPAPLPRGHGRPRRGRGLRWSASTWVDVARAQGALVFADVGWDPLQQWPRHVLDRLARVDVFMPNAVEAMAYTGTTARRLEAVYALADRVPVAVVTDGADGALGIDARTGEEARVPSLRVHEVDPTGAGDVFGAALLVGTLAEWPLEQRMTFASLCAGLALEQYGGSLAAPGWGDLSDWWTALVSARSSDAYHRSLRRRFAFLDDIVPRVPVSACRRASATIARRADVPAID